MILSDKVLQIATDLGFVYNNEIGWNARWEYKTKHFVINIDCTGEVQLCHSDYGDEPIKIDVKNWHDDYEADLRNLIDFVNICDTVKEQQ